MKTSAIRRGLLLMFTCTVVAGLAACTSSYKQRETGGLDASSVRLDANKNVFVSVPPDGQYGSRTYPGTGRTVAQKTLLRFRDMCGASRSAAGPLRTATSFWQPRARPAPAIL